MYTVSRSLSFETFREVVRMSYISEVEERKADVRIGTVFYVMHAGTHMQAVDIYENGFDVVDVEYPEGGSFFHEFSNLDVGWTFSNKEPVKL